MPKFIIIHIKVHMNPAPGHFSVTLTVVYFRHVRVLTCFWLKNVLTPTFICVVWTWRGLRDMNSYVGRIIYIFILIINSLAENF